MGKTVYIIGSKGIPAKYGGFETFVEKLTEFQKDKDIQYYVACMRENSSLESQRMFLNIMVPHALTLMFRILDRLVQSLMILLPSTRQLK